MNSNLVGSFTLKRPDRRRAAKAEGHEPTTPGCTGGDKAGKFFIVFAGDFVTSPQWK